MMLEIIVLAVLGYTLLAGLCLIVCDTIRKIGGR